MKLWLNTVSNRRNLPNAASLVNEGEANRLERGCGRLHTLLQLVDSMRADGLMALGTGKVLVTVEAGEGETEVL